jgi:hypothetical protein
LICCGGGGREGGRDGGLVLVRRRKRAREREEEKKEKKKTKELMKISHNSQKETNRPKVHFNNGIERKKERQQQFETVLGGKLASCFVFI